MDPIGYVFLGVIAAASLVQAVVLIAVLVSARRLAQSAGERVDALERELRPQLTRLGQVADGIAQLSDRAQRRFTDVESAIGDATDKVRRTGDVVERVVRQPAGAFAAALVFTVARRLLARRAARA
jgi:methyl-accepting chemotaxis protein